MALPSSGQITLNQVNVELGLSGTAQIGLGDSSVRTLFGVASGQITMSNGYGKANVFTLTFSSHTANPDINALATAAGWDGSTELIVQVNSGIYVYSTDNNPNYFGLHANVPCTINNYGNIIGQGGIGGGSFQPGGQALKISSSGVTVINHSGAYIAGGGGGGNGSYGGGGAGGGIGGQSSLNGGAPGQVGGDGTSGNGGSYYMGKGGGAGGGAGGINNARSYQLTGSGGGGGRIVPGTGGAGGSGGVGKGGDGGSANNVGQGGSGPVGVAGQWQRLTSGGGGGWAATGGFENGIDGVGPPWDNPGGAGGPAISASTSYTLTNNGTIYGAT
jgi:hypothetical protein